MTQPNNHQPAQLWTAQDNNLVQCRLCSHCCRIQPGDRGRCGVRQNQQGQLYTLNYGKAISANIDPIEKKPLYHFLPGTKIFSVATAGCNFKCDFCQNWQISQITKEKSGQIIGDDLPPEAIVILVNNYQLPAIAYTYTEPTIFFEYAYETAVLAKKKQIKNIFVTNGYQTPETINKMAEVIDAVNIDLKSFSNKYYRQVCGASLKPVLKAIKLMHERGMWIEITTLVVPGQNDSKQELTQIAHFIAELDVNIPWHLSRFFPSYKMDHAHVTPITKIEKAYRIGKEAGLNYIYAGNIPTQEYSHTFCPQCGHKVITRHHHSVNLDLLDSDHCPQCQTQIAGVFA